MGVLLLYPSSPAPILQLANTADNYAPTVDLVDDFQIFQLNDYDEDNARSLWRQYS